MKILLLSHCFYPQIGGIEVNSEVIADSLVSMNHEVHIVTWSLDTGDKIFPFKVVRRPSFFKLIAEHKWADVILENNPCLRLSWPNVLFSKPLVIVLNTWVSRVSGKVAFQDILKLKWMQHASKVIAVSTAVKNATFKNAIVIGNPYRDKLFKNLKHIERNKDFVFLGRLVSDKGADLAIKAFEQLIGLNELHYAENSKLTLTVIGDGPDLNNLKNLVKNSGICDQVFFTGTLVGESLINSLNQHRFLLVPSRWKEPFGNIALEGLACGCIPIVADGGGLPEAIGEAGFVFERDNLNSLVNAMLQLLNNSDLVECLRSKAEAHLGHHTPSVVCSKYNDVLVDAMKPELIQLTCS